MVYFILFSVSFAYVHGLRRTPRERAATYCRIYTACLDYGEPLTRPLLPALRSAEDREEALLPYGPLLRRCIRNQRENEKNDRGHGFLVPSAHSRHTQNPFGHASSAPEA